MENTVITEPQCGPRRRGLHHVAAEAINGSASSTTFAP